MEWLTVGVLVLFLTGLWFGATRTILRILLYHRMGWQYPKLIWRDLIGQGGLALSFLLITAGRLLIAMGHVPPDFLNQQWWWIVLSSAPAIVAVWTYAYYEVFELDRFDVEGRER